MCAEHRCRSILALFLGGRKGGDFGLTVVLVCCFPFEEVFLLRIERELNCRSCDYVCVCAARVARVHTHTHRRINKEGRGRPIYAPVCRFTFLLGVNLKTTTQQGRQSRRKTPTRKTRKERGKPVAAPTPPQRFHTHTRTHQGTGSALVLSICTPLMRFHTMRRVNPRPKVHVSMAYARATQADLHCLRSYSAWDEVVLKRRAQHR